MNKEAVLIYLPEFTQAEINHIVRTKLVAERYFMISKDDVQIQSSMLRAARQIHEATDAVFNALLERQMEAQAKIGTSDPAELADALLQLDDVVYDHRAETLSGIRLLPLGKRTMNGEDQMKKNGRVLDVGKWGRLLRHSSTVVVLAYSHYSGIKTRISSFCSIHSLDFVVRIKRHQRVYLCPVIMSLTRNSVSSFLTT